MALISVSGEPGCRPEELARLTARKLGCDLLTESSVAEMIAREVGIQAPDRAWPFLVTSIVAGLLARGHLVISANGSELLFRKFPGVLRIRVIAPEARRVGDLMIDRRMDRNAAKDALKELTLADIKLRASRFGRGTSRTEDFDLVLNAEAFTPDQMLELVESAIRHKCMFESGTLSAEAEAQVQFQARLQLANPYLAN